TVHSGKLLAKRASPLVWQLLISLITKKVSQQLMRSMVVKCLPAVGAAAINGSMVKLFDSHYW
ncbi:MAG: hypothetical protein ACK46E_05510, partial [Pseudanabaena sp.]